MRSRCKLCRGRLTDRSQDQNCSCGWVLDANCAHNHRHWCPDDGRDNWVGAVEL
ncbi:hypothetical protein [Halorientalis litorea]|uniref:hypothetical protein n=1 Tax=Halorientalis litorea TaxID=2931977 RepID=UPI001FF5A089|nr:hypothetical protein [Halorientalis litorea]